MKAFSGSRRVVLFFIVVLSGYFFWLCFLDDFSAQRKIINISPGAGLSEVADELEREGVVRKAEIFSLLVFLTNGQKKLKYGKYAFSPEDTPYSVYRKLIRGKVFLRKVTFPEGITLLQMAEILEASQVTSREDFLALASSKEYATRKLGVQVPSLEGFLFPDTYFFEEGYSAQKVIEAMLGRFMEALSTLGVSDADRDIKRLATVASIIEKETGFSPEKPLISAVIRNRLKRGMRLEKDPTVIYALGEKFTGDLKRKDLKFPSPYNTYVVFGLPPGPIAAPGLDSLRAALNPADADYLYFFSRGDGSHYFSKTYAEHLNLVRRSLNKQK